MRNLFCQHIIDWALCSGEVCIAHGVTEPLTDSTSWSTQSSCGGVMRPAAPPVCLPGDDILANSSTFKIPSTFVNVLMYCTRCIRIEWKCEVCSRGFVRRSSGVVYSSGIGKINEGFFTRWSAVSCLCGRSGEWTSVLRWCWLTRIKSTKKKKNLKNCGIPIINGGWTD